MKTTIALLLVGLCAFAIAGQTNVNQYGKQYKVADKVFLQRQKDILRLFRNVLQTNYYQDQVEIARNHNLEQNMDRYNNRQVVAELLSYYQQGMLPRGEVFSIFYEVQRQQAVALTQVLYYAKDYETFYKTACWAREFLNEGMFVYAMQVAVLHRDDTQGIVLPAIYEIYPYYFVNSEVIDKAYEYKMKYDGKNQASDKQNIYYVQANYTGWYLNSNPEQYDMSYYTEDVGLNAYYYYYNMDYPSWMGGEEYGLNKDRRGELYYYFHQQLLARYYLERLSNGYGSIPTFNWEEPIKTGFVPTMRYSNGLQFPARPAYTKLGYNPHNQAFTTSGEDNQMTIEQIQDYERRIRDAIDMGYIITEDGQKVNIYEKQGLDILGRIIESNPDSPNRQYYGYLHIIARQVLGYATQPMDAYKIQPSVLEQFETTLRDPAFYQLYKRIIYYFLQYKSNLPNYTQKQIRYQGVQIQNVEIDKLITYMDNYEYDITNAVYMTEKEFQQDKFQIRARQYRLNHKPFTYKINVQSDKSSDVVVRVFLGPKYDEQGRDIPMNDNRINFVELDKFMYTLKSGKTVIERNSRQGETVKDRTSYRVLYQRVMAALEGQQEFHLDMSEAHNGFPNRFVLPRGTEAGQMYQLYVHIAPYQPAQQQTNYDEAISAGVGSGSRYVDSMPFGYPLDRQIDNEQAFFVPNSYIQDVVIYHKTEADLNTSRY